MRTRLITWLTSLLRLFFRRQPPVPTLPRTILIVKPCCLGDVLLTTPLVATIRASFPQALITYAVGSWSRPMVATNAHVDAAITLPDRWTPGAFLATLRELRRRRFDLVFVPERSPRYTILVWLAGIPVRIGLDSQGRGFAYTQRVPVTSIVMHEADLYSRLAEAAGLPQPPKRLFFFPDPPAVQRAAQRIAALGVSTGLLIVLHPGGGQNPGMTLHRKRWLPARWALVADELRQRHAATIVLVGGPGDEAAVTAVATAMREPATTIVQRWDWGELGALIQQADLFLGHDTGMMHLATAVGTPTVAVFGPSDPQVYGPYSDRATVVWRPTYESPCFLDGTVVIDCPCAMQCMRNVTIQDVVTAAERLLYQAKET